MCDQEQGKRKRNVVDKKIYLCSKCKVVDSD